ncbi:cupin [Candidatus Peregrinibacteria bacterium HGW-Peregrinibacteria-1]|jgi:mannose-6-phosphate isomerase-like protein (cupin superfamily)|nr:MAG: cupin [Candidatus Peregrinibacteria bacterium HGW-Peregrinibacteria-1]
MDIINTPPVQIKLKPWGREIWFAHTDQYAGKILEIKAGHRYSLQYHEKKRETQYLYSGQAKLIFGEKEDNLQEKILNPGDKVEVTPFMIHRVEAIQDTEIFEVSTAELDDVIKLHDDYGRSGQGNNEELDNQLHLNS